MNTKNSHGIWYEEEHYSTSIILAGSIAMIFLLWKGVMSDDYFVAYWIASFITFFVILQFFSVSVKADEQYVLARYGVGFLESRIDIYSISEAIYIQNDSLFTMAYSPKAEGAVRIRLREGRSYSFPARKPKAFAQRLMVLRNR